MHYDRERKKHKGFLSFLVLVTIEKKRVREKLSSTLFPLEIHIPGFELNWNLAKLQLLYSILNNNFVIRMNFKKTHQN